MLAGPTGLIKINPVAVTYSNIQIIHCKNIYSKVAKKGNENERCNPSAPKYTIYSIRTHIFACPHKGNKNEHCSPNIPKYLKCSI